MANHSEFTSGKLTKEQALAKIEELKQFIEQEDKPKGRFKPEHLEEYYTIDEEGEVLDDTWVDGSTSDNAIYAVGNCYKTGSKAEDVVQNRKVHVRLQEIADLAPDWEDVSKLKYHLLWSPRDKSIGWSCWWNCQYPNTVYFANTVPDIEAQIDTEFGEGALKQYLTGSVI